MITSTPTFGEDLADIDAVEPDALALLGRWLPANEGELRPLMTLSTIGLDGYPAARNVLLSKFDGSHLHFNTDASSRKVAELRVNPRVAVTLVWPEIGRQVVVQGDAAEVPPADAAEVFAARSRYLQLLAWANDPETAQLPLAERRARWAEFGRTHPEGTLSAPEWWTGFRVTPVRMLFWRGDPDGPSTRTEYVRAGDAWTISRLPG